MVQPPIVPTEATQTTTRGEAARVAVAASPATASLIADRALVVRAQGGDAEAFASLVGRLERMALAVAYAAVGPPPDGDRAAEVVQEALVRAWAKLTTLREPERFAPWLANIVRHAAMDQRRRASREASRREAGPSGPDGKGDGLAALPALGGDPAGELEARETRRIVGDSLACLDEVSRCAVVLRYYENLSSRQIAELLDVTPAAVDMRLMRARAELKRLLAGAGLLGAPPPRQDQTASSGRRP